MYNISQTQITQTKWAANVFNWLPHPFRKHFPARLFANFNYREKDLSSVFWVWSFFPHIYSLCASYLHLAIVNNGLLQSHIYIYIHFANICDLVSVESPQSLKSSAYIFCRRQCIYHENSIDGKTREIYLNQQIRHWTLNIYIWGNPLQIVQKKLEKAIV